MMEETFGTLPPNDSSKPGYAAEPCTMNPQVACSMSSRAMLATNIRGPTLNCALLRLSERPSNSTQSTMPMISSAARA